MHILITNDDGVQAPGLQALAQAFQSLGKVTIFAPDRNWSASGHVKTMHRPLRVRETQLSDGTPALTSDGAPSDCVALALLGIIKEPIDLVVSGINPLANVGHDLTYSGTVTAAMEAAIAGIPGIAYSIDPPRDYKGPVVYDTAASIAAEIAQQVMARTTGEHLLLNVNIPLGHRHQIEGIAITRQGIRIYHDALDERLDPRGHTYYWIGGEAPGGVVEPGTDFWALAHHYVSVTPLTLDLSDKTKLATIEAWDLKL
ncbi:MAG: 5'/3'-nucleotidase SurE [Anaerolineales bacterium]|nr:MAG: 5'/3'-nucleotidase SurE [Anaerolineales bacterium]